MERKQTSKFLYIVLTLLLAITAALIGGQFRLPAFAEVSGNSNVLKDLQKDSDFNADDYPYVASNYSINVIQIAESATGYVYVYTYQPCQLSRYIIATHINMSTSENAIDTDLYDLILVNTSGVFAKYLVKGVMVSNASSRCYNITSIYRARDKEIDGETGNNNTIDEKAYAVNRLFRVRTENGILVYSSDPTYTVQIINPYVDYLIYITNQGLPNISSIRLSGGRYDYFDGHYVAFSTDWEIDRLKSATVSYAYCTGTGTYDTFLGFDCGGNLEYGAVQRTTVSPTYLDRAVIDETGMFGVRYQYEWDRIQTVAEFIASESGLTDETKTNLEGKQWVLRFLETERTQTEVGAVGYKHYSTNFTKVDQVTILRLEFDVDGKTYNLGAVSDMQSGDLFPGNADKKATQTFWEWLAELLGVDSKTAKIIFWVAVALIVLAIALPVLSVIFPAFGKILLTILKAIGKGLLWLLKGFWWLICLPFKGLAKLFKKLKQRARERRQRKEEERQAKLEQERQMRLYKHQNNLERKEEKRQRRLDRKDAQKAQKAKDKQTAKRRKKAAKKKRKTAKSKNRGKGGKKK